MDTFEFLTVFVYIILGLGMTYLILGVGKFLRRKEYYRFYWLHFMQIINIYFLILNSWWITYSWMGMINLTFLHFLFIMCSPCVVVLASSLLFPSGGKTNVIDLKEHYFSNSKMFYILFSLWYPLDLIDTLLKGTQHLSDLGGLYIVLIASSFIIVLSAAFIRKPLYHGFVQSFIIIRLLVAKIAYNLTLDSLI